MADVIRLSPPKSTAPRWRECNCGCQEFRLYEDGQVQCIECDLMQDEVAGYWTIPDPGRA